MSQSLPSFKSQFNESLLRLLWSHWASLGVSGYGDVINHVIDPEALILITATVGRYDQRLFDAMIEWMMENERLVNINRLKTMLKKESFLCENVIQAIAETVSKTGNATKWKKFISQKENNDIEPLFLNSDSFSGRGKDPVFLKYGFERSIFKKRDLVSSFSVKTPATLHLRLRSFFGVNARSEIVGYLLSNKTGVARDISRYSYYFLRTIQEALSEMASSGVLISKNVPGKKREIQYSLAGNDMANMFSYERAENKSICWAALYSALEKIFNLINNKDFENYSEILQNSELRRVEREYLSDMFNRSGIDIVLPEGSDYPGTEYRSKVYGFIAEKLFNRLIF